MLLWQHCPFGDLRVCVEITPIQPQKDLHNPRMIPCVSGGGGGGLGIPIGENPPCDEALPVLVKQYPGAAADGLLPMLDETKASRAALFTCTSYVITTQTPKGSKKWSSLKMSPILH